MPNDIQILVNGVGLIGFLEYTSRHSFDKVSGTLDLKISPQPGSTMPIKLGDAIVAIVSGKPVLTGYVHEVDGDDDWSHDYRVIHARDKTQDFHDSTVGPQKPNRPPVTLQEVLQKTVKGMGLDFQVIDKVSPDKFEKGEVPSAEIDEFGHAFGDRLARQRQVLLNTDGRGNLVIDRNKGQAGPGMLFRGPPDHPLNNIKSAKYRNTDLNRHNQHAVNAQHSPNDKQHWESKPKGYKPAQAGPSSKEWGICNDDGVRPQRRRHHRAHQSLQRGKTKGAASWRSNTTKARGFQYVATVAGYEAAPGTPWWPGFVIPVYDYKYEISAELLIVDVEFHKNWGGGSTTKLTLTYKDGFSDKCGVTSAKDGRTSSLGSGAPAQQSLADAGDLETVD